MHIFNMSTTNMQADGQTGANLNAPDYRHGGIKIALFINVATLQRPNFDKKHHSDKLLALPNLADL